MRAAAAHHLPHSQWLAWDRDDRDADLALQVYQSEACAGCGVHPAVTDPKRGGNRNALVPKWVQCRVCELVEQAQAAGPPDTRVKGWHLVIVPPEEAARG